MNRAPIDPHRVILMDLRPQLGGFMQVLADYCDVDYREGGGMLTEQEILSLTVNFLNIEDNVSEAIIAMGVQVNTFCKYLPTPFNKHRVHDAISRYMREMYLLFKQFRMYGPDTYLAYTFGSWHDEYVPIFVPLTHMQYWPEAIPSMVGGEPIDPRPGKIFYPYLDTPDPWATWPFTPSDKDVVPY